MANAGVRGRPIVSLVLSAQERAVSFRCFVVGKRDAPNSSRFTMW